MNLMHVEFISRPVSDREFLLLLEKTILVERYREIMKYISEEAESRIEAFENLMDIKRKDIFASEEEKEGFKNILNYEKNLIKKQSDLNKAIREYTQKRQKEIF